jgi:hypothetical protein
VLLVRVLRLLVLLQVLLLLVLLPLVLLQMGLCGHKGSGALRA